MLNNYAYYLAEADENRPRALELSTRLMELAPMEPNFMDTHAWTLYKNGRYPEALDYITQALFNPKTKARRFGNTTGTSIGHGGHGRCGGLRQRAIEAGGDADALNTKIQAHQ